MVKLRHISKFRMIIVAIISSMLVDLYKKRIPIQPLLNRQ